LFVGVQNFLKLPFYPRVKTNFLLCRPASSEVPDIIRLMDAGMTMARFNMAHGTNKVRRQT
jgi:hypothetical protein